MSSNLYYDDALRAKIERQYRRCLAVVKFVNWIVGWTGFRLTFSYPKFSSAWWVVHDLGAEELHRQNTVRSLQEIASKAGPNFSLAFVSEQAREESDDRG